MPILGWFWRSWDEIPCYPSGSWRILVDLGGRTLVVETSWNTLKFYDDVWFCAPARIAYSSGVMSAMDHNCDRCSHDANRFWRRIFSHTHIVAAVATLIHHIYTTYKYKTRIHIGLALFTLPRFHMHSRETHRRVCRDPKPRNRYPHISFPRTIQSTYWPAIWMIWICKWAPPRQTPKPITSNFPTGSPTGDSFREEKANWEAHRWWSLGTLVVDCHYLSNPPSQGWH